MASRRVPRRPAGRPAAHPHRQVGPPPARRM